MLNGFLRSLWDFGWKHPAVLLPAHVLTIALYVVTYPFNRD